ncbi:MAG: hypothetical protein LBR34_04275, partial [Prevotella sp.]|nr:hypothetical protein [Prevotella sp.]
EIDITGYVFGNLSDNLRVALTAGTSGVQDGTVFIHSLENGNYAYVPQLIFSAPTSLSEVMPDESNAPVRYYNLQGVEVAAPTKGAIYIVRQGAKAKKVVY